VLNWLKADQPKFSPTTWSNVLQYNPSRSKVSQLWNFVAQYEALYLSFSNRGILPCDGSLVFLGNQILPRDVINALTLSYYLLTCRQDCAVSCYLSAGSLSNVNLSTCCQGTSPCVAGTVCSTCSALLTKKGLSTDTYNLIKVLANYLELVNIGSIPTIPHC